MKPLASSRCRAGNNEPGFKTNVPRDAALVVELLSMFVHQRDGWTAVAGLGLILSIVGAVLVLIAGWLRRPAVEAAP